MGKYKAVAGKNIDLEFLNRDNPMTQWELTALHMVNNFDSNRMKVKEGSDLTMHQMNKKIRELWKNPEFRRAYGNAADSMDISPNTAPAMINFSKVMGPYLLNRRDQIKAKNDKAVINERIFPEAKDPETTILTTEDAKKAKEKYAEDAKLEVGVAGTDAYKYYCDQAIGRTLGDKFILGKFSMLDRSWPGYKAEIAKVANSKDMDEFEKNVLEFQTNEQIPNALRNNLIEEIVAPVMENYMNQLKEENINRNFDSYMDGYLNDKVAKEDKQLADAFSTREKYYKEMAEEAKKKAEKEKAEKEKAEKEKADEAKVEQMQQPKQPKKGPKPGFKLPAKVAEKKKDVEVKDNAPGKNNIVEDNFAPKEEAAPKKEPAQKKGFLDDMVVFSEDEINEAKKMNPSKKQQKAAAQPKGGKKNAVEAEIDALEVGALVPEDNKENKKVEEPKKEEPKKEGLEQEAQKKEGPEQEEKKAEVQPKGEKKDEANKQVKAEPKDKNEAVFDGDALNILFGEKEPEVENIQDKPVINAENIQDKPVIDAENAKKANVFDEKHQKMAEDAIKGIMEKYIPEDIRKNIKGDEIFDYLTLGDKSLNESPYKDLPREEKIKLYMDAITDYEALDVIDEIEGEQVKNEVKLDDLCQEVLPVKTFVDDAKEAKKAMEEKAEEDKAKEEKQDKEPENKAEEKVEEKAKEKAEEKKEDEKKEPEVKDNNADKKKGVEKLNFKEFQSRNRSKSESHKHMDKKNANKKMVDEKDKESGKDKANEKKEMVYGKH